MASQAGREPAASSKQGHAALPLRAVDTRRPQAPEPECCSLSLHEFPWSHSSPGVCFQLLCGKSLQTSVPGTQPSLSLLTSPGVSDLDWVQPSSSPAVLWVAPPGVYGFTRRSGGLCGSHLDHPCPEGGPKLLHQVAEFSATRESQPGCSCHAC